MISLNFALARAERKGIEKFAGEHFLPRDSILEKIPYLRTHKDQQFLFGIYDSGEKWTVLSVCYLYASYDGQLATLRIDNETSSVFKYYRENDFSDNANFDDGRQIWMGSPELSQQILNVMLMLEKIPCGTVLT